MYTENFNLNISETYIDIGQKMGNFLKNPKMQLKSYIQVNKNKLEVICGTTGSDTEITFSIHRKATEQTSIFFCS